MGVVTGLVDRVVVDVVDGIGGMVPRDGVGRQVVTRNPSEKAASPSGWRGSLNPAGRLPTVPKVSEMMLLHVI